MAPAKMKKIGPNHCNLVLFFICSLNLEHIRVMAPIMKVSLSLPALQRLDRCLNTLYSNLYRSSGILSFDWTRAIDWIQLVFAPWPGATFAVQ